MNLIPKENVIHSLLDNPKERFVIPSYQRRYAWKEAQQEALFKDIDMLRPNEGHLFGMLILHTGHHHGGINDVKVVDGQQRLTTLSILLHVIHEKFVELDETYLARQISQKLYCGDPEASNKPKLVLGELDNPDYLNLLSGDFDGVKNQRLLNGYQLFQDYIDEGLEEKDKEWLIGYFEKLNHAAKVIRLDVQEAKDAYKLFETINNRGLGLSPTDILKNFILGHAAKLSDEKLEIVRDLWTKLIVTLDGINTDDFFRQYISSLLTRKVTKNKLTEEFKNRYFKEVNAVDELGEYRYNYGELESDEDTDEEGLDQKVEDEKSDNKINRVDLDVFLQRIVNAAETYSKIVYKEFDDPKVNQKLKELQDIRCFPSYIFLMHYLREDHPRKEVLETLNLIGTLMLRRHVAGKSTARNDDIFANLLRVKPKDRKPKVIKEKLLEWNPTDNEFKYSLPNHDFKPRVRDRARYMLAEFEYYITGNTNELSVNSPEDVHIEHIIPQKIHTKKSKRKYGDWENYLGKEAIQVHKKKKDRIGNLTLLAQDLNIIASNNPFGKKKESYEDSNIELTQRLAKKDDFRFDDLDKRGERLAEIAVEIWSL